MKLLTLFLVFLAGGGAGLILLACFVVCGQASDGCASKYPERYKMPFPKVPR